MSARSCERRSCTLLIRTVDTMVLPSDGPLYATFCATSGGSHRVRGGGGEWYVARIGVEGVLAEESDDDSHLRKHFNLTRRSRMPHQARCRQQWRVYSYCAVPRFSGVDCSSHLLRRLILCNWLWGRRCGTYYCSNHH